MATSTQQLQQALAQASGAPKPVSMETLPEAEINVRGGTDISLQLEALGTGRKKKQELPVSSASGALLIQDLYGDLLEGIDYDDPVSIQDFKSNVYERTLDLGFDKAGFDPVDTPSLPQMPNVFESDEGGEDFQSLGGDGGTGADSFTSEDYSVSPTAGSSFVAQYGPSIAGSAISGDLDLGSTATSFGISSALSGSTTGQIASGLQSGLSAYTSGFSISNPLDAISLASNLYGAAKGITSLQNIANVPGEIVSGISKIGETVSDLVTDPLGTITTGIQQAGNQLEFGTTNPTINTVSGFQNYNFVTGPDGKLTVPGMVGAMAGPLGGAVNLATGIMGEIGYFDDLLNEYQTEQTIGLAGSYSEVAPGISIGTGMNQTSIATFETPEGKISVNLAGIPPGQMTVSDFYDNLHGQSRSSAFGLAQDFEYQEELDAIVEQAVNSFNDIGDYSNLTTEQSKTFNNYFSGPEYDPFSLQAANIPGMNIVGQITTRPVGEGLDTFEAPEAPTGPETGLSLEELESRMEDINKFGEPVDDPAAQDPASMSRDIESLTDPSFGSVDPGDTFGGPDDPDTQAETNADKADMYDIDEIESALDYDPDGEGSGSGSGAGSGDTDNEDEDGEW